MPVTQKNKIKESEIEEAFVSNLLCLKEVLGLRHELKVLARQLRMKAGNQRLDLLIAHGRELCLVELKIERFKKPHLGQVNDYREELLSLQRSGKLVNAPIRAFLLVTEFAPEDKSFCASHSVELVKCKPIDVLTDYFDRLYMITPFFKLKPRDYGVFNIGLVNRVVRCVGMGILEDTELAEQTGLSVSSVRHHLRFARQFRLVRQRGNRYSLTDLGDKYVSLGEQEILGEVISDKQAKLLKQFIGKDPFYSSTVFGIYAILESVFILSRNSYPVDFKSLARTFRLVSGKLHEWRSAKSQSTATYTFLNFAVDLGLLGKIGSQIVITPSGFQFMLMLQLHKSIEMLESLSNK